MDEKKKKKQMKKSLLSKHVLCWNQNIPTTMPIYCYWYPGFLHRQVISNDGIDNMNGNFYTTKDCKLFVPPQCWEMIEDANIYFLVRKWIEHD